MIKRPLCVMCLFMIGWIVISGQSGMKQETSRSSDYEGKQVSVAGQLYKQEQSDTSTVLYLINNSMSIISDLHLKINTNSDLKSKSNQTNSNQTNSFQSSSTQSNSFQTASHSQAKEIKGQIIVYLKMPYNNKEKIKKEKANYKMGNWLQITGEYEEAEAPGNPGQFDTVRYYESKGIEFAVKKAEVRVLDENYWPVREWMAKTKARFQIIFEEIVGVENASILSAMILGEKKGLDKEVKTLYQDNGIAHILAISGLHISLLGMGLYKLLRKLGGPFLLSGIFSGIFMIGYGIMTGLGISTLRAVIMFVAYLAAGVLGRTYDILSALSLAAVLILLKSPNNLYDAGFLLSFGAVLGISAVAPALKNAAGIKSKLWDTLSVSLGIQLTTIPIVLYFYYVIPLYGIILNLFVIPLMSFVLVFGIAGCLTGLFSLIGGIFLASPCYYILGIYKLLCMWTLMLPAAQLVIGRPGIGQMIAYCLLLMLMCIFKQKNNKLDLIKWVIGSILLLGIIFYQPRSGFSITFLDVGQGDGISMESPEGLQYFIDGGSSDITKVGSGRIEPFLSYKGIKTIDYYMISHMDADHISGLLEILEGYSLNLIDVNSGGVHIRHLVLPKTRQKDDAYKKIESLALKNKIPVIYFGKGDKLLDREVTIRCLHPSGKFTEEERNESSMVLEVTYKNFKILLTGDVEGIGEERLLEGNELKDVDVLKAAHHGSENSMSEEFLRLVKPEHTIISCGKDNRYGHPHPALIDRLRGIGSRYYITPLEGAITITSDGNSYQLSSFK